jgi:hypothetical protein
MPSTVISTINYDVETATLRITYVSGSVYDYKNVPESVFLELRSSHSKGAFFNQQIKNRFPFEKIK